MTTPGVQASGPGLATNTALGLSSLTALPGAAKAQVRPVDIAALEQRFGWAAGGWQDRLLHSADGNQDGQVTRADVDAYLAKGGNAQFVTSEVLALLGREVSAQTGPSSATKDVTRAADRNHDGTVVQDEFVAYVKDVQAGVGGVRWVPNQQAALFASDVAELTGEADDLLPSGLTGPVLDREYLRIQEDTATVVPRLASYQLNAADMLETPATVVRKNRFHKDAAWPASPVPLDYKKSGVDQGHLKPAEDSPTLEAMDESFLMTNMAPQYGVLNQYTWAYLEAGIRQLVEATGGKATIHTGTLFVDAQGKPLPLDQVKRAGPKKLAVPTHFFKAVLLTLPDGTRRSFAYVVPNLSTLSRKSADAQTLLAQSRVSVAALERTLGPSVDLFPGLPADVGPQVKADPAPTFTFDKKYTHANRLWPQP